MFLIPGKALLLLSALTVPLAHTSFVSFLPQCIQDCIDQSQDDNCSVTDVACLCRASAGNFLPDLIICTHDSCERDLDNDLLLNPLQIVCEIAGVPIPESAIRSAENQASSLDAQKTTIVTIGWASATGGREATTTVSMAVMESSVSTKTVTKTLSGETIYVVYPITVGSKTTVSGKPSTVTSISTKSTGRFPSGTASDSALSTTTLTTSVQAAETSSSGSSRRPSTDPEVTNSSPFTTTNNNGASKESVGSLRVFSVFLMAYCLWY
jgi:hypothetical protein